MTRIDKCKFFAADEPAAVAFVDLSQVHQACYGVPKVPKGPWFCRTCKFNVVNPVSPVALGTFNLCSQFL